MITEIVDAHIDMSKNKRRYLIGPAVKPHTSSSSSKQPTYNDEPEAFDPTNTDDIGEEHEEEQDVENHSVRTENNTKEQNRTEKDD